MVLTTKKQLRELYNENYNYFGSTRTRITAQSMRAANRGAQAGTINLEMKPNPRDCLGVFASPSNLSETLRLGKGLGLSKGDFSQWPQFALGLSDSKPWTASTRHGLPKFSEVHYF